MSVNGRKRNGRNGRKADIASAWFTLTIGNMENEYMPEFGGANLEDSYFLGIIAEGGDLRLRVLFALTTDHPDYAPPLPGEAHCYREGSSVRKQPSIVEWLPGKPNVARDLDGTFDFGSIGLHWLTPSRFQISTEWFDATVEVAHMHLDLSPLNVR